MRRVRVVNPKELSRTAKFYSLLSVPDLLIIFATMFLSSLVSFSPVMTTIFIITLLVTRKYINRNHNCDFIECKLRNKNKLLWFDFFNNIKKGKKDGIPYN